MVCPVCHEPISEDMKFCGRCGTKIPRCPVCGKIIEKRMRFCLNDGTPLPEEILSVFPMDESAQTFQSEALPKQPVPLSLQEDGEPSAASPATEGGQKTVPLRESVGTDGWNTESGLAIDTQDAHPVAVQRFCLMCGQPCPPGAELCEACQDRIMAEELVTAKGGSNRTRRKRQRSRAVLIAVVLLLMLALVGSAAGYIAYGGAFRERFLIQKDDGIGPEESLEGNAVESAPSYGGVAAVERHDGGIEPETVPELETELETGSEPKEVAAREMEEEPDIEDTLYSDDAVYQIASAKVRGVTIQSATEENWAYNWLKIYYNSFFADSEVPLALETWFQTYVPYECAAEAGWQDAWIQIQSNIDDTNPMDDVYNVSASSELAQPEYNLLHSADRLVDGTLDDAWSEGVDGQGEGEFITISLSNLRVLSGMVMYAGYQRSESLYYKNSRPSLIRIAFDDGDFEEIPLMDVLGRQDLAFSRMHYASQVMITILSVYPGNNYSDTVISELSLY